MAKPAESAIGRRCPPQDLDFFQFAIGIMTDLAHPAMAEGIELRGLRPIAPRKGPM